MWNCILNDNAVQKGIYSQQYYIDRMVERMRRANVEEVYSEWRRIAKLFSYEGKNDPKRIDDLIFEVTHTISSKLIIVDLSEVNAPGDIYWNEEMKIVLISQFLSKLTKQAEEEYKKKGRSLNTLVIIDEAHRLAPKEVPKTDSNTNLDEVKWILIDAIRTTRKFGLGWMFISQTLSSLDREIINQIRLFVIGFGLAWGIERQALREIIGGAEEAIRLYQSFKDPQSTLGEREYPFMSTGPISPLSFSGSPLFFTSLKYPSEFLLVNFGIKSTKI